MEKTYLEIKERLIQGQSEEQLFKDKINIEKQVV